MFSFNHEISLSLDFASATIAVVALLISFIVSRRQARVALQNLRLQRDNAIIQWSNRGLDHLCYAEMILRQEYHAVMPQAEYEKIRLETMRDISSCADQGRMFFPNVPHETHGREKLPAFRGHRHPVLDCLVDAYRLLDQAKRHPDVRSFESERNEVLDSKKRFISLVQSEPDPQGLRRFLTEYLVDKPKAAASKSA